MFNVTIETSIGVVQTIPFESKLDADIFVRQMQETKKRMDERYRNHALTNVKVCVLGGGEGSISLGERLCEGGDPGE